MTIPKSYEALAADLASEKIISKTLHGQKEAYMMIADSLKIELDDALAHESELKSGLKTTLNDLHGRDDAVYDLRIGLKAAQDRESALREELETSQRALANCKLALDAQTHNYGVTNLQLIASQQRLTVAEQRVGDLEQMLSDVPQIHFEGCDFQGFNSDGSEPFEFTDGPVKKIKSIRLIGWRCDGPRMAEEGITVKDKLPIAEKELADLHAEIKAAGKPPHGDYWHQSLYEAEKKVADAKAALKPAAEGEGS